MTIHLGWPCMAWLIASLSYTGLWSMWSFWLAFCEDWVPKNWCFWTMVLEKTLESPLDGKEIKPVDPEGNQPWIYIGRTEAPKHWPSDAKSWLIGKDPEAGEDLGQEEKGATEDEMVGWHYWLNGYEFEQTPEVVKDREAWSAVVHGVTMSWTGLSDWTTKLSQLALVITIIVNIYWDFCISSVYINKVISNQIPDKYKCPVDSAVMYTL